MLYLFNKERKTDEYFRAACVFRSVQLYAEAYEIYREIAENFFLKRKIRGEAAYYMYLLAKENKVALSPIKQHGMILRTSQQRCEGLLMWSASFGYHPPAPKLPNTPQPALTPHQRFRNN